MESEVLNLDDERIIELFFERDETALEMVFEKYMKVISKIEGNLLDRKEDVEECTSSVMMTLWEQIPPDRPKNLCAYACKIAKRQAINKLKYSTAEKRSANLTLSLSELEECLPARQTAENEADMKVLTGLLNKFLLSQSETDRNIFVRRYWYTDSLSDISKMYSINERTVSTRLFRMRKKLKSYLEKEGYIYE